MGVPLYEFRCETCGVFDSWRSLAESSQPAFCPTCDREGRRIFSAPAVNLSSVLPSRARGAEPALVQKTEREPQAARCQSQACGRPWMLNH